MIQVALKKTKLLSVNDNVTSLKRLDYYLIQIHLYKVNPSRAYNEATEAHLFNLKNNYHI